MCICLCIYGIYLWKNTKNWYFGCVWGGELDSCGTGREGNFYYISFCTFYILYHVTIIPIKIIIFKTNILS